MYTSIIAPLILLYFKVGMFIRWWLSGTGLPTYKRYMHKKLIGDRTFAAAGPRLWNSILIQLCNPDITYRLFRWQLKGHPFDVTSICGTLEKHFLTYLLITYCLYYWALWSVSTSPLWIHVYCIVKVTWPSDNDVRTVSCVAITGETSWLFWRISVQSAASNISQTLDDWSSWCLSQMASWQTKQRPSGALGTAEMFTVCWCCGLKQ